MVYLFDMPIPNVPSVAPVPVTATEALPLPNAASGTPELMNASASRVNMVGNAIGNTANGLWPVLGGVAMLGLTWMGLKAIVLGKNPLKS